MFLCGNYSHQLDDKNRIRLPSKLRAGLGEKYVLLPGTNGCIYLFADAEPENILKQLCSLDSLDPDREEALRLLFSEGCTAEADSQGRFLLPENLINFAGIDKNVEINGHYDRVEIWSSERWKERRAKTDVSPKGIDEIYRYLNKAKEQ